ncbi:putative integral membrane protein [Thiorhodovibrio winogradskyi]|uniref:Integral membrane protein n=1 Tax=Thiorhodovibrio winogradskyi TaxID=77007 RepID=A0ABZ0SAL2_9GAMM|nr:glycosyltransferase family 39 protein [Thiorhodovibrio winogradskyi]
MEKPAIEKRELLWLFAILIVGFLIRFAIWNNTAETGLYITDEKDYALLAQNLLAGNGFAWEEGKPTSIRPPGYPTFIAAIWFITGDQDPQSVRFVQILLSLFSIALLYRIGRIAFSSNVALLAAGIFSLYPTYVGFASFLYAEVLFIFLMLFVILVYLRMTNASVSLFSLATTAGLLLGLAALTRTIAWPYFLVFVPLVLFTVGNDLKTRLKASSAVVLGFFLIIAPWSYRNSELQNQFTLIDTMGGMNLMMGNYEHTPLNRAWDAVSLLSTDKRWSYSLGSIPESADWGEAERSKWASDQAKQFMLSHPLLTIERSIAKFFSFWGLERVIIAAWERELYHPPKWSIPVLAVVINSAYILTMLLAVVGLFLAPPNEQKFHYLVWTLLVVFTGVHMLIFGHARYHLPLMPLLILYAASAVDRRAWKALLDKKLAAYIAMLCIALLLLIWGREVFFIEGDRIATLMKSIR